MMCFRNDEGKTWVKLIFSITVLLMVSNISFNLTWYRDDIFVLTSFFVNGIIWFLLCMSEIDKYNFSINFVQWFFCEFFFFVAPLSQYLSSNFPSRIYLSDIVCLWSNILLLVWTIFYVVGVRIADKKIVTVDEEDKTWIPNSAIECLLIILAIFACAYIVDVRGFENLFSRGTRSMNVDIGFDFYFDRVLGAIVYFSIVYSNAIRSSKIRYFFIGCCFFVLLVAFFPLGIARQTAAGIYLALLLFYFRKSFSGNWFIPLLIFSFIFVFPLLNLCRTVMLEDINFSDGVDVLLNDYAIYWQTINYDAYSLFAVSCQYFWEKGIEWGHQLLGTVFFWVPRAWWPAKPITTGAFIAEYAGFSFINVSSALPEEFMVDFGIVGVIIGAFVVGYFSTRFDNRYWIGKDERFAPLYFTMVSFAMIFYRGQLMSAFAFWSPYLFVWFLTTRRFGKKK